MVSQSGSVGFTIMGRLLTWQMYRRQSLTPSTWRVSDKRPLLKKLVVHRVLSPSIFTESWVEGKGAQATWVTAAMRGLSSKIHSRIWGELHKEWTEAGDSTSRATTHREILDMGYKYCIPHVKPLLNQRQGQKHLTWAVEKKNWTVAQWSNVLF